MFNIIAILFILGLGFLGYLAFQRITDPSVKLAKQDVEMEKARIEQLTQVTKDAAAATQRGDHVEAEMLNKVVADLRSVITGTIVAPESSSYQETVDKVAAKRDQMLRDELLG